MSRKTLILTVIASMSLAAIGVVVFVVAREMSDPLGRGEHAVERRVTATAPAGQPMPVSLVETDRFREAFNADTSETRLLVMLSPT